MSEAPEYSVVCGADPNLNEMSAPQEELAELTQVGGTGASNDCRRSARRRFDICSGREPVATDLSFSRPLMRRMFSV